jgi:hypothetical protein
MKEELTGALSAVGIIAITQKFLRVVIARQHPLVYLMRSRYVATIENIYVPTTYKITLQLEAVTSYIHLRAAR